MKKILSSNRSKSLIINAVILTTILLCVQVVYETNDDHTIAKMIAAGYANIGFVNYYLCKALIGIQTLMPGVNAFVLSQIALSFTAFVVLLRLVMDKSESKLVYLVAVAAITLFSIDHYASIQFTKTSALLISVGFLLLLDSAIGNRHWLYYCEGALLVIIGSMYRWNTLLPALGYLCAFVGVFVVIALFDGTQGSLKDKAPVFKQLAMCLLVVMVASGCGYGLNKFSARANTSTEQLKIAKEYSSLRARITDFPTDDLYEKYQDECDAINVDDNDIYMIHKWLFDYDGAASIENLRVLSSLGKQASTDRLTVTQVVKKCGKSIIKSVRKLDYTGWHIVVLALLSLLIILSTKPKNWLYVLGFGGLTLVLYLVLYYMQRPVYRTLYIADVGAMIWLLYVAATNSNTKHLITKIVAVLLVICCCVALPSEAMHLNKRYKNLVHKTRSSELDEYFDEHNDSIFVCEVNGWNNARTYTEPLRVSTNNNSNEVSIGGWSTLSPYQMNKIKKYGMTNPIKDLINNDKAYFVGNARLVELKTYYNKWYGDGENSIELIAVDTVGGKKIWRIVKK